MPENPINATEAAERDYLEHVKEKIAAELDEVNRRVRSRHAEMQELQAYLQENTAEHGPCREGLDKTIGQYNDDDRRGGPRSAGAARQAPGVAVLRREARRFLDSEHNSLGIICKTQDQANELYERLADLHEAVRLLDAESTVFSGGVMIATALLAKGLEFDRVILPFCGEKQYNTVIDRHMLYVGCTRAMHRLTITYSRRPSPFLEGVIGQSVVSHQEADSR